MNELVKKIEKVIELFEKSLKTEELELESKADDIKIRLKKNSFGFVQPPFRSSLKHSENMSLPVNPRQQVQTSKSVGIFRRSKKGQKSLVKVNDFVKKNQVLGYIECSGLMNEIEAEVEGRIIEILATKGEGVEYGQPIFLIKPKP